MVAVGGRRRRSPAERQMLLVCLLLSRRRPVPSQELWQVMDDDYPANPSSRERAFHRDLEILIEQGFRIEYDAEADEPGYVVRRDPGGGAPFRLTAGQRLSLVSAASKALAEGFVLRDELVRALAKLTGAAGRSDQLVTDLAHLPRREADPVLACLVSAVLEKQTVRIEHRGLPRTVDPYGLVQARGGTYLVGRCHDREKIRTFHVGRMGQTTVVAGAPSFEVPADFRAEQHAPPEASALKIHAPVAVLLRPVGGTTLDESLGADAGGLVHTTHLDGLLSAVCASVGRAVIEGPAEVRSMLVERLYGLRNRLQEAP